MYEGNSFHISKTIAFLSFYRNKSSWLFVYFPTPCINYNKPSDKGKLLFSNIVFFVFVFVFCLFLCFLAFLFLFFSVYFFHFSMYFILFLVLSYFLIGFFSTLLQLSFSFILLVFGKFFNTKISL